MLTIVIQSLQFLGAVEIWWCDLTTLDFQPIPLLFIAIQLLKVLRSFPPTYQQLSAWKNGNCLSMDHRLYRSSKIFKKHAIFFQLSNTLYSLRHVLLDVRLHPVLLGPKPSQPEDRSERWWSQKYNFTTYYITNKPIAL